MKTLTQMLCQRSHASDASDIDSHLLRTLATVCCVEDCLTQLHEVLYVACSVNS